uniref:exosome complex exonuclease RRP44-like isoform X1 n=2 Tax=Myxine glutinosa TaxID=7769 RepID=UPI00358EC805
MLKSKTFVKKTRAGGFLKVVREHYLRDDIGCGSELCSSCPREPGAILLQAEPLLESELCSRPHYIILDTNIVFHQIDILEASVIQNVIVMQTVLQEVRHRSAPVYKRLKDIIAVPTKRFYTFTNEHHRETYVEVQKGETTNDYKDRAIRMAAAWYQKHLGSDLHIEILLITNDLQNRDKARADGIRAYTLAEYIKSLLANPELMDKLAFSNEEGIVETGRIIFPEHLPLSLVQQGIRAGRLLQGTFRANRDHFLEGRVRVHQDGKDDMEVLLKGLKHLNRAVHDDLVAVELLPKEKWAAPSSLLLQDDVAATADGVEAETPDPESEEQVVAAATTARRPTGRVVGIIKRNWRPYCGMLMASQIKEAVKHLFHPADRRIPRVRVETRQARILQGQRIIVSIDGWPRSSRYPNGHYVRSLGTAGDRDTESEVLLLEHDVTHLPFSQATLACLPSPSWQATPEDVCDRADLRELQVCSIDPPGCTDIDDALHLRELTGGNMEVGVHIADVSHFIRPNTSLDKEAGERGTTVYLCEKRIDMVPPLLSSNLCSLLCNVDRLAFSCIWEVNKDAEIISTKFTKSIINSKASLSYAEAQLILDDPNRQDALATSLRHLNRLAQVLRKKRLRNGALVLASPEIRFHMDSETHDPIDLQCKELKETNSLVEEFMLLANISVAKKIQQEFPDCALLRRHPPPPPSNYDILIRAAEGKDLVLRTDSAKALAESLEKAESPTEPYLNTLLRILATRCMMQAIYFSSGSESDFSHYGLATPIYTHFTSPIRRYADLVVHRLLAVSINADATFPSLLDRQGQQSMCNNLNYRHKMAQYAQRASVNLHTQLFLKKRGTFGEDAYVLTVRKNAIAVLIPKYGLEGLVFFDRIDNPNLNFCEETPSLTVSGVTLHMFDKVIVCISLDDSNIQHQRIRMTLLEPKISGYESPLRDSTGEGPVTKKVKQK